MFKRAFETFLSLCLLCLILTIVLLLLSGVVPLPDGLRLFTVDTGSMAPAIPAGSIVVTTKAGDVVPGDVITYRHPSGAVDFITHRVKAITAAGYYTQGDANGVEDGQVVTGNEIAGRVVVVLPYLGNFFLFILTKSGLVLVVVLPSVLLLSYEMHKLMKKGRPKTAPPRIFNRQSIITFFMVLMICGTGATIFLFFANDHSVLAADSSIVHTIIQSVQQKVVSQSQPQPLISPVVETQQ